MVVVDFVVVVGLALDGPWVVVVDLVDVVVVVDLLEVVVVLSDVVLLVVEGPGRHWIDRSLRVLCSLKGYATRISPANTRDWSTCKHIHLHMPLVQCSLVLHLHGITCQHA